VSREKLATHNWNTVLLAIVIIVGGCGDSSKAPQDAASKSGTAATVPVPAGFSERLPDELRSVAIEGGGKCNLERVNGQVFLNEAIVVPRSGELQLEGWIINQSGTASMERIWLRASAGSKVLYSSTEAGLKRPDIVTAFGSPSYEASGFSAQMDSSKQPGGDYSLTLIGLSKGRAYMCDNGRRISLR
jgi:hypothetical protein